MTLRFGLKPGDLLLMAAILLCAVLLFCLPLLGASAAEAEIVILETGQTQRVMLQRDAIYPITSRGISMTVCVAGGEIFVAASDCRDGICRNTFPISRAGQTIVCAPAGVIVRVIGEEAVVDGIAG